MITLIHCLHKRLSSNKGVYSNILSNICIVCLFIFIPFIGNAQDAKTDTYIQIITKRANKIVADLELNDSVTFYAVQKVLVDQYASINKTQEGFNTQVKILKKDTALATDVRLQKMAAVEAQRKNTMAILHQSFIKSLSQYINENQINKIKDGMTYNKVAVTYNGYLAMVPSLTNDQKTQIKSYLEEARELAMDAESSEKKTEWFGKYKGRINNYLAVQGYDLKKEGDAWQERIQLAKKNKQP